MYYNKDYIVFYYSSTGSIGEVTSITHSTIHKNTRINIICILYIMNTIILINIPKISIMSKMVSVLVNGLVAEHADYT